MKQLLAAVAVLAIAVAGCDSSEPLPPGVTTTTTRPPPPPSPSIEEVQKVDECPGLVDVGVLFVENMIATLEAGLPIDVLTGDEPAPPEMQLLQEMGTELDRRAALLGCDVGDLNKDIVAGVHDYESNDPVVMLFLDIVRSGVVSFLPEVPGGGADS